MLNTENHKRAEQDIKAIRGMYNKWAAVYHEECETGFNGYTAPQVVCDAIAEVMPDKNAVSQIIDAGAGTGYALQLLKQDFANAHKIALDLSPGMLEKCEQRGLADETHETNLDGQKWPTFEKESDLVISVGVTGLIADMPNFINEASKNLKQGGVLALTFLRRSHGVNMSLSAGKVIEYPRHHFEINQLAEASGLQKINGDDDFTGYKFRSENQLFGLYLGRKL